MFFYYSLHLCHPRTGGVDDLETFLPNCLSFLGRNSMGSYGYPAPLLGLCQIFGTTDPSPLQDLQNLIVVNERSIGMNNLVRLAVPGGIQHQINGAPHPHTKTSILSYFYLHYCSPQCPWSVVRGPSPETAWRIEHSAKRRILDLIMLCAWRPALCGERSELRQRTHLVYKVEKKSSQIFIMSFRCLQSLKEARKRALPCSLLLYHISRERTPESDWRPWSDSS